MEGKFENPAALLPIRLAIGLAQGIALYLLYLAADAKVWPATSGVTFAPLLMVLWLMPIIVMAGLGNLRGRSLVIWGIAAALLLAGLAVYDIYRGGEADLGLSYVLAGVPEGEPRILPSPILVFFSLVALFIAQTMIVAGDADRRLIGSYPRHFDAGWKHAVQLALAAAFVGALWLLLVLGAGLFSLIKIDFLGHLLERRWFAMPVTALALAAAIHLSDVNPGIVRGLRTLGLMLLSWLLPLGALLVAGFLASLPFTGLAPLWATRFATTLLLVAAGALVVLINAAYQDGQAESAPTRVLRLAGSLAGLMLVPLVAVAAYALALRVLQYGWTTERISAAAAITVAACFALGYGWAVLRGGVWMKRIESCNMATALVALGVLVALFSPIADPVRLSVASQLARLESGKIAASDFDFDYLRFDGARYGRAALERLKDTQQGADAPMVRQRALAALNAKSRWDDEKDRPSASELAANIIGIYPAGRSLPAGFTDYPWSKVADYWRLPRCLLDRNAKCEAYLVDLDGDGIDEVLMINVPQSASAMPLSNATVLAQKSGGWRIVGFFPAPIGCEKVRQALRDGDFKLVSPVWRNIEVAGERLEWTGSNELTGSIAADSRTCP